MGICRQTVPRMRIIVSFQAHAPPSCTCKICGINMEFDDDDSDEDFKFDSGPRYVVPSYCQQLYSSHNLVPAAENDDDGWNSDDESYLPVVPQQEDPHPILQEYKKPFMMYEDDVWVDEARAVLSAPDGGGKISPCLHEMFDEHKDVFTLLLAFLQRSGKNRHQKQSLVRKAVDEFKRWLGKASHPKNAVLTPDHQKEALGVLTRCHPMLMDDVCTIFDLKSTPEDDQVVLIKTLLSNGKMNEAVTYTWKLGLQRHFNMMEMLLPLLAVDKVNMIENYIDGSRQLQEEFVLLVDKLCEPGKTYKQIKSFLEGCGITSSTIDPEALMTPNSKLNSQQLYKLGIRFIQRYNLKLDLFPHLFKRKSSASLHHMLHSKYVEGAITDENMDDLIEAAVTNQDSGVLKMQLIKELLRYHDKAAAAKWARRLNIAMEFLPFALQAYMTSEPEMVYNSSSDTDVTDDTCTAKSDYYYSLTIPPSQVVFVSDEHGLQTCWKTIAKPNMIIGVDCEWRLPACNGGIERLALMQLAVSSSVFLLDMVHLPSAVPEKTLKEFMGYLFGSRNNLKLGYGITADFKMLSRSWTFSADVISSPKRVLDLQMLARMVEGLKLSALQTNTCSCALPCHPLLQQTGGSNCQNSIPNHPPLHSTSSPHNHETLNIQDLQKSLQASCCLHPYHRGQSTDAVTASDTKLCDTTSTSACILTPPKPEQLSSSDCDDTISSVSESVGYSMATGLSLLVERCLGKPLDKSQQLSDWERRPLKEKQIRYAALDAHCLLAVYECLKSRALSIDPHFNTEPTLDC